MNPKHPSFPNRTELASQQWFSVTCLFISPSQRAPGRDLPVYYTTNCVTVTHWQTSGLVRSTKRFCWKFCIFQQHKNSEIRQNLTKSPSRFGLRSPLNCSVLQLIFLMPKQNIITRNLRPHTTVKKLNLCSSINLCTATVLLP